MIDMKVKLNGNDYFEVSSPFGVTDSVHITPHTGLDLVMSTGTKLFSPTDGIVSKIVNYGNENIGKGVIIKTNDGENLIMGHLSDNSIVKIGQKIQKGDLVAISGNTGHSTGSHLHLGLKDANGTFVNPDKFLNEHGGAVTKILAKGNEGGGSDGFFDFIQTWHETGSFWVAMYGKSFFDVLKDFGIELIKDVYVFILENGEAFFILPAVVIMFATFMVGRNRFTKWIIPLWFGYFVTAILKIMNCLPPQ